MIEYPKIDTLYERGADFSVTDVLKSPVIGTINEWHVTEKIDGTNIRIDLRNTRPDGYGDGAVFPDVVTFGGRTSAAQLHAELINHIQSTFTVEKMAALRLDAEPTTITLFGEGYGAGIQKGGGAYRKDRAVILYDVLIGDKWWLEYSDVVEIAGKLGVPVVPSLGVMTLAQIRGLVPTLASVASEEPREAEGIVARPIETLYDKHHRRLVIKLKASDFRKGKRRE